MHEIVAIIFRLINFAILIVAGIYLFKRYALDWINEQIAGQAQELDLLQHQDQALARQQADNELAITEQEKLYQALLQKLDAWNNMFTIAKKQREREKGQTIILLQQKVAKQQNHLAVMRAQKEILPAAINNAQQVLMNEFTSSERGHQYIKSLIVYMGDRKP